MADYVGEVATGVSDQAGASSGRAQLGGISTNVTAAKDLPAQTFKGAQVPVLPLGGLWVATGDSLTSLRTPPSWPGHEVAVPHSLWFEHVHVQPERIELGNLLGTVEHDIEIYNAYREASRQLSVAIANVDSGVTLQNLPSLPFSITSQGNLVFQVRITTSGPPEIEGTLDFTMDTGSHSIPVTGVRVVMFAYPPESPVGETLTWKTNILEAVDGQEQRISVRKNPRQVFNFNLKIENDASRRFLQSLLFGFQPGTFGLPIWHEARELTAAITASDTTIYLNTANADFRADSLAIVWKSPLEYDALEVSSFTASSITFSSPVLNSYEIGETLVMPLRTAITNSNIEQGKHLNNLEELSMQFTVFDNDVDLADDSVYDTHNGFVLLDQANFVSGAMLNDNIVRKMSRIDNQMAPPVQFSDWATSRFATTKGWVCNNAADIWQVRQLLHALRGSQVTFYMPTFYEDIVVTGTLSSGSYLMDVAYMGYDSLVQANEPHVSVWIKLNSGTVITREVTDHEVLTATTERLTVGTSWGSTVAPEDIERVCFLRRCRVADDKLTFRHDFFGQSVAFMNVLAVQS